MKKFLLLSLIILTCFPVLTFAETITKEQLKTSLENIFSADESTQNYTYDVTDNEIIINTGERTTKLEYVIDDNYATFTKKCTVQNGVSYEEFDKNINTLSDALIGYMMIANIKGIDYGKVTSYVLAVMLNSLNFESSAESTHYWVVDDDMGFDDENFVTKSNFPNMAVTVAKANYPESEFRDDADDEWTINSLLIKMEHQNETSDSIDIVETVKVDLNADFSKIDNFDDIKDVIDDMSKNVNVSEGSDIVKDAYDNYADNVSNEPQTSNEVNNNAPAENPKTGINKYTFLLGISVVSLGLFISLRRKKLFRNI